MPKRVWGSGAYSHSAVAYWAQIAALAQRSERCRASVVTLARFMGDAKRTTERYLAELSAPGPDGEPELSTIRHTDAAGDGESAERWTRPAMRGEHFAYVPIAAAKTLRRPLFVLYCALTYATATNTPVTAAELAELLGVTERSARRMTDELEALGWITVHRRAGVHGRHTYTVHDHPLRPVAEEPVRPDTDGGSGADRTGGSLAYKEDAGLTDESTTQVGGAFRRRRDDRKWVAEPVDTAGNSSVVPLALRGSVRPAERPAHAGPQLTLSPRVWAVLAPVADLLPVAGDFAVRRIAREIGRQLDEGIWADDIRDQLARLRAWTPTEDIRDPGRWILGAALPVRPGRCGSDTCYLGFQRYTGAPCKACAELEADRHRGAHPPHTAGPQPHACTACGWTSPTPLPQQRCATCRTA
ncbi:hypothetical protein [Streptomyces luteogriseus]|uniref:hypothetical protein n=1 Tax=Streptomyces luteogriseus TaxID=68233 RepID=UPI00369D4F28